MKETGSGTDISHLNIHSPERPRNSIKFKNRPFINCGVTSEDHTEEDEEYDSPGDNAKERVKKKGTLLLENLNTDTHLLLNKSTSNDDGFTVSVATQRPSGLDFENKSTLEEEYNSQEATKPISLSTNVIEVESAANLHIGDSYREQMQTLLQKKQPESQEIMMLIEANEP